MANAQRAGFRPSKVRNGGHIELARKRVISNNTTGIFCGDAVIGVNDGGVVVATSSTAAIASIARGASYVTGGQRVERKYLPAATTYSGTTVENENASYVYVVADALGVDYMCTADEALAVTNILNNFGIVLGTGNTATGMSQHELDASTANTTNSLPMRLIEFCFGGDIDPDSADATVMVRINAGYVEPALNTTGT